MPVYTRTGDKGETSLFGGKHVRKNDALIEVLGSLDELNSHLGLLVSFEKNAKRKQFLLGLQKDIQYINGYISGGTKTIALDEKIKKMENMIDELEQKLPELHSFIFPGGTVFASEIHIARSVCRRAERRVVDLDSSSYNAVIAFLNRLSDFLFTFARCMNTKQGKELIGNKK